VQRGANLLGMNEPGRPLFDPRGWLFHGQRDMIDPFIVSDSSETHFSESSQIPVLPILFNTSGRFCSSIAVWAKTASAKSTLFRLSITFF
jgi:hypothetical protein